MKIKIISACNIPGLGLAQTGQILEAKKGYKKKFQSLVKSGIAIEIKEDKK